VSAIEEPESEPPETETRGADAFEGTDPLTAMTPTFGRLARAFGQRFFAGFRLDPEAVRELREIQSRGAVVYVMRYASRLDYFLFNWLFLREGLAPSNFANGIRFYYYRPIWDAFRTAVRGILLRLRLGSGGLRALGIRRVRALSSSGGTMFLFLRTDKIRSRLKTRKGAVRTGQSEYDYLREIVSTCVDEEAPVDLVPLALFWRKGPRAQRRFLNVFYGAPERPTDTGKIVSFLWNYRNLAVRVGTAIDLKSFVEERRSDGAERITKQVRRSVLIFLRREEKPVAGAAFRPRYRVEELVLGDPEVQHAIGEAAAQQGHSRERLERRARKDLREIASHPSPTTLAVLDVLVGWIFRKLFERLEVHGLDRVTQAAKLHPLVLAPCHRSHLDYLIVSWLFYERHLVPPLVAAGINLSFWPLGPIFRRAGAFFLRRTFEGNRLYATVFRSYVRQLIKDGVTQEFFVEGTRSRTGRTLEPRLGMLGMALEAYARGIRRDVYIVPVGFTYERLVEEGSITEERRGASKARENLLALMQARQVLRRRHGSVIIRFGEPISLAEQLGSERAVLASSDPADSPARRDVTSRFGFSLCRRLNELVSPGRTHVAAAALLTTPSGGISRQEFIRRAEQIVELLRHFGLSLGEALEEDLRVGDLPSTVALLEEAGLIRRIPDRRGEILTFDDRAREILDYYRGALASTLVLAGSMALSLRDRATPESLVERASEWLDLLALEVLPLEGPEREARLRDLIAYAEARGFVNTDLEGRLCASEKGEPWCELLAAQVRPLLEAYRALTEAVLELGGSARRERVEQEARALHRRHLLLGEASFPEGLCDATLGNALRWLVNERYLEGDANLRRPEAEVRPGPRWGELESLCERVAAPLTGG
jgi:glycerol-3-phosphate O-acyltransferase